MARVRIPGLGHSLMEDGTWQPTSVNPTLGYKFRDPAKTPTSRKAERQADERGHMATLWQALADRGVESGVREGEA